MSKSDPQTIETFTEGLRSCPFCGHEKPYVTNDFDNTNHYESRCPNCITNGPHGNTREDVVNRWNARKNV